MEKLLKAGVVSYINTAPMVSALINGAVTLKGWELEATTPAIISQRLMNDTYHAGLVSSFAYTQGGANRFVILPNISISSVGRVQSVLLFHNKPLPKLRKIHLSNSSLTSSNLIRLLMALEGVSCDYIPIAGEETLLGPHNMEGVMLIGDQALREVRKGRFAFVSDLAALWYDRFGLPFVFALWVINRSLTQSAPDSVTLLHQALQESLTYGYNNLLDIATHSAGTIGYTATEAKEYLAALSYSLDASHIRGLKLFFSLLECYGIIAQAPPICFFNQHE